MLAVAKDPGRAYTSTTAPALQVVKLAFGGDADISWLYMFLDYFVQYYGKGTLSPLQMADVARRLSAKSHLKVTEYMLFFWRLGNADYGRFFGDIDPMAITDSFNKFLKQRDDEVGRYTATRADDVAESSERHILKGEEIRAVQQRLLDKAKRENNKDEIIWLENFVLPPHR